MAKRYAVEQQQRYNERNIRDWKKREAAAMTDKEQQLSAKKVAEWQAQQRALQDIAEREGIPFYRQYPREQIGGDTKPADKLAKVEQNIIQSNKNVIILTKDNIVKETSQGTIINEIKYRAQMRSATRHISPEMVNDALTAPEAKIEIKTQSGRTSTNYIFNDVTVCINAKTGSIITVYKKDN